MKEMTIDDVTYYGVQGPNGSINAIFYFHVEFETEELTDEEIDKLPGEKHDPDRDYSPTYKIANDEMIEWLTENVKPGYRINMTHFFFDNQEDAMAFKLRWS